MFSNKRKRLLPKLQKNIKSEKSPKKRSKKNKKYLPDL